MAFGNNDTLGARDSLIGEEWCGVSVPTFFVVSTEAV